MNRAVVAIFVVGCAIAFGAPSVPEPTHFSHADHRSRGVDVDTCATCHAVGATSAVLAPAAKGHAPCMNAGCHATWFIATGETMKKSDPALHAKANAFCLGCHDAVPSRWNKPPTNAVKASFRLHREYHVEMNHYEHTARARKSGELCSTCHIVDSKTHALVAGTPGHAQCVQCHNAKDFPEFAMDKCGICHSPPARATYFKGNRPDVDVRGCGSEGHAVLERKLGRAVPCYRHEREQHRIAGGKPVQCATCHYMIADKARWGRRRYQTLKDLHTEPIIDNAGERQHASCGGTSACHKAEVSLTAGAKCNLCHAEKSIF